MDDEILVALNELGVESPEYKSEKLSRYIDEILLFNPTLKLVGEKTRKEIVFRHILDSSSAFKVFLRYSKKGDRIADLGSGAGLPGIVLAVLFPDREFVLIERMQRRVGFLRGVKAKLRLDNVSILDRDIKDIDEKFDALTCRAFHPISSFSDVALCLLNEGGVALFYQGRADKVKGTINELERNYDFSFTEYPLDVSFVSDEREILVLREWRKK